MDSLIDKERYDALQPIFYDQQKELDQKHTNVMYEDFDAPFTEVFDDV